MGVEIWRKKAVERSVWAIILKEALVILYGQYANEEEEEEEVRFIIPLTIRTACCNIR
jgi:hypothetical protein